MAIALMAGMEIVLNQTLFIRLQILNLEPAEVCLAVHSHEGEGNIYVSYRKILSARFGMLTGPVALSAMLRLKNAWLSESLESCPDGGNLNCFIEEFIMEVLNDDPAQNETKWIQTKPRDRFARPAVWQGLINHYEITLTVVGGPWDGHVFEVFPGANLVGKIPECDVHLPMETVSRRHCSILLTETQIRVIDLGSLNGTYLNGVHVQDAILAPEDDLHVGDVNLKISYTLRRPGMGPSRAWETLDQKGQIRKEGDPPRLADCKTINWKEFVPKKQQILSKIINGLKMT